MLGGFNATGGGYAAQLARQADEDATSPRHGADLRGVDPSPDVDVHDGLFVLASLPFLTPVLVLRHLRLAGEHRAAPVLVVPLGVGWEEDHLLVVIGDDGYVGKGARDVRAARLGRGVGVGATGSRLRIRLPKVGHGLLAGPVQAAGHGGQFPPPEPPLGIVGAISAGGQAREGRHRCWRARRPGILGGAGPGGTEEQASAVAGNDVDKAGLGCAAVMAADYEAVDARLEAVLDPGEGVEVEAQQPLAASMADGAGGHEDATPAAGVLSQLAGAAEPAGSKRSQSWSWSDGSVIKPAALSAGPLWMQSVV